MLNDNFTLISDSLCKYINQTNQIHVQGFPGVNLSGLRWKIGLGKVRLNEFKIIILHVGTNDVQLKSVSEIVELYHKLIISVRNLASCRAVIAVSAIIPRPTDECRYGLKRKIINKELCKLAKICNCTFLRTYSVFENSKTKIPITKLYAKDGLHLNCRGIHVMKKFIVGNVITLQEKLKH